MIIGTAIAVCSGAAGVWFGVLWNDYTLQATKETHKREMDEISDEVRRLRAQVASLIGQE
jgi:cell division protein FtsB